MMIRFGLALGLGMLAIGSAEAARYQYLDKSLVEVVDGDTVTYRGKTIRILGLNAPEVHRVCPAEIALGLQAKAKAAELVANARHLRALYQYRTTRGGKVVRATDKYGRALARLSVDRQDWAALLISAGLAAAWDGRGPKPSWCPAPQAGAAK